MDAPVANRSTDVLGRRSGPRRRYSLAEKRAIVEETQARGASVPEVAQRHGINHNLIFGWRRLYQQGLLSAEATAASVPLLGAIAVYTPQWSWRAIVRPPSAGGIAGIGRSREGGGRRHPGGRRRPSVTEP